MRVVQALCYLGVRLRCGLAIDYKLQSSLHFGARRMLGGSLSAMYKAHETMCMANSLAQSTRLMHRPWRTTLHDWSTALDALSLLVGPMRAAQTMVQIVQRATINISSAHRHVTCYDPSNFSGGRCCCNHSTFLMVGAWWCWNT